MDLQHEDLLPPVREFPDRALRWLFRHPRNLQGLIQIAAPELVEPIDFSRLKVLPRSYVLDDFREHESDLVFEAPYRPLSGEPRSELMIYLLLENQSQPNPFIGFRFLHYMTDIWNDQWQKWDARKVGRPKRWFRPILPVLFYSGSRPWKIAPDMAQRILQPTELDRFVPRHDVVFLPLPDCPPEELVAGDNLLGWLLRVMQLQNAPADKYTAEVELASKQLQGLTKADEPYWKQLMYFLYAFSYHRRDPSERPVLTGILEKTARSVTRRKELEKMGKTIAESLIEEGMEKGKEEGKEEGRKEGRKEGREEGIIRGEQEALIYVLQSRFGRVSKTVERKIRKIDDLEKLRSLLGQASTADSTKEVDID